MEKLILFKILIMMNIFYAIYVIYNQNKINLKKNKEVTRQ